MAKQVNNNFTKCCSTIWLK